MNTSLDLLTLSYRRASGRLLALGAAVVLVTLPALGQAASEASPATAGSGESVVKMSQFEVTTTQGSGYVEDNSARGFKTNQQLLDIPQADIVVTSDFINDTGYNNSSDVLRYVGVASQYRGEALSQRGTRDANSYLDDMRDPSEGFQDDSIVDSYDVIKGPAAVLYQNAALSGVIIKNSKKPLPYRQIILSESVQEWGQSRTVLDYNAPIGQIQDTKFMFRLIGVVQVGKEYWENTSDRRFVLHPMIAITYKNTTVRVAYDFENLFTAAEPQSLMTLNGKLWTGWGRKVNGLPPGDSDAVKNQHEAIRLEFLTKISDTWENRFQAEFSNLRYYGSFIQTTQSVDWVGLTEKYRAVLYNLPTQVWLTMDDVTGKFQLGPVGLQSTFGFATSDEVDKSLAWTGVAFGTNDSISVPITNTVLLNSLGIPSPQSYSVPANPGSRTKGLIDNIYYQQEFDFFNNRLALVGGFTFESLETISDGNLAANAPYSASDVNGHAWLHRFGAVAHLTKDIALYALTSTTFSPGSGVNYLNQHSPNINGQGNEVGLKTALLDGRLSSQFAVYHAALTNQQIIGPGFNVNGVGYYVPIGSTTSKGVDGDIAFALTPGWQLIATGYVGTVKNQAGVLAISGTYDNSWSLFTRYAFDYGDKAGESWLKGLAVGAGVNRIGSYWLSTGSFSVVPAGYQLPNAVKFHEGTPINAFVEYKFHKHWSAELSGENLLDQTYVVSSQTATTVDPSPPFQLTLNVTFKY